MRPYLVSQSHYLASRNLLTTTRKTRSNRIFGGWGMSAESLFPDIPKKWTVTTLGELAKASGGDIQTGPFGSQLHASDYVDDGIPSIMPKNITVDAITTDDIARVSSDDVERLSKYKVQVGDIIYSRRGDVEKCARITETEDGWLCGTGCLRVRIKPTIISTEFLHAYLCHPVVREWIVRHAVGATMPNLNTSILSALPVGIPNKSEMTAIGSIWLTISDQIRLNSQINQTLEQMAQAIFKSWFVDFEPVKAKIAALEAGGSEEDALLAAMQAISAKDEIELARLQAEQPEQYAELRATAELFPSAMQDSELGEIPEGWIYGTLSDLADFSSNRISKDELSLETYISTENMLANRKGIVTAVTLPSSASVPSFEPGEILISNIRPYFKKIWLATFEGGRSPDVLGFRSRHPGTSEYLFNFLYRDEFFGYMMLTSKGAKMPRGDKEAIMQYADVIPPVDLMQSFSERVRPFYILATSHNRETKSLTAVRETLLPKLLSGELSVPQALEQLTDVAEAINS